MGIIKGTCVDKQNFLLQSSRLAKHKAALTWKSNNLFGLVLF